MVTVGVAASVVGVWLARQNNIDRVAGNVLGITFTVCGFAMLFFGIVTLHDSGSVTNDLPPNLPVPAFVGFFALLCGLEIAGTLAWIIRSDRKIKLRLLKEE